MLSGMDVDLRSSKITNFRDFFAFLEREQPLDT
jgi:hypothetical protein